MEIRSLVPQLLDDYLSLFDAAFSDNPYWMGCYCAFYDDPCSDDQWTAGADVAPAHRDAKCERIRAGQANGLLAYDDYLRDLGMATAEGYPRAAPPTDPDFPWTAASYKGTRDMYEDAGYHLHRTLDRFLVMRKDL